ncbi:MAG: POTRA domain-containing protein [Ignavibacteriota bacterium]
MQDNPIIEFLIRTGATVALICVFASAGLCKPNYIISAIHINGALTISPEDILGSFVSKTGDTLREDIFQLDINNVLRQYERSGFPLARISIEKIMPRGIDSLDIYLLIDEGKRPHLVEVKVSGAQYTDSSIVEREFFVNEKPLYDPITIEASRNRLLHLGIFSEIGDVTIFAVSDSTIGIEINVTESHSTSIDGILGYNPPRLTGESGFISGFASLSFTNIGGTARNASLEFRRETHATQELGAIYTEPWVLGLPANAQFSFYQRDEDSIYTRTNFTLEPGIFLSNGFNLSTSFAYDKVVPGAAEVVNESKSLTFGVQGSFDSRDNLHSPRSGFMLSLGAGYGTKQISGNSHIDGLPSRSLSVRTLSFEGSYATKTFSERLIFVPSLSAKMVEIGNHDLEVSDLFHVGGLRTLRGYSESQFLVSRFVILQAEERLMTGSNSFIGLFLDYGYLQRPQTAAFEEQTLYPLGYGVSFQFDTQLGLLLASVALSKGETFDRAKLHFGVVKDF